MGLDTGSSFPFMCGNKHLFTILIRPYLNNRTLAKLAGTCQSVRDYVTKDLKMHWFSEFLRENKLLAIEKFVRVKPCTKKCFYGRYKFPVDNVTDQQFSDRKVYDENGYAWDDLPFYVYNKKLGSLNRIFGVNDRKLIVCKNGCYQPKYFPVTNSQNMKHFSNQVSYYHKVIFSRVYYTTMASIKSDIESELYFIQRNRQELELAERELKYKQSMLEVKLILDNMG